MTLGAVVLSLGIGGAAQKAQATDLINGGFEQPVVPGGVGLVNEASVPGWETTSTDNLIENKLVRLFNEN